MLKSISELDKKQEHIYFMTGHVKRGISDRFKGNINIINQVENWQGTGKVFEFTVVKLTQKNSTKKIQKI